MKTGSAVCLSTPVSQSVPEMEGIHATGGMGGSYFEDVCLEEFMYRVSTCMPGGVAVGNPGLCCYVPCLSICLLIVHEWISCFW